MAAQRKSTRLLMKKSRDPYLPKNQEKNRLKKHRSVKRIFLFIVSNKSNLTGRKIDLNILYEATAEHFNVFNQ